VRHASILATVCLLLLPAGVVAQGRGQPAASIDLTGYWVSLITDNWTYRAMTPPKGDYLYLPINADARRVADTWDPAKDEAAGEQCKAYGPVGVMRMPTRLHIMWHDERTLKLETDTGMQARIFHFAPNQPPSTSRSLQGISQAEWQIRGGGRSLKVTTTQMKPGYIHKNGVPHSENAVLVEYFTTVTDRGITYLLDTLMLEDSKYLTQSFVRTALFKKQADATGWEPTSCSAR
jgi:hypothetical protein